VTFPFADGFTLEHVTTTQNSTQDKIDKVLDFCVVPRTREKVQAHVDIATREYFRKTILKPLLDSGQILMTVPDKPNSRNQKYIKSSSCNNCD
jgi:ATP-dependent DNA helicase RecG